MKAIFTKIKSYQQLKQENNTLKVLLDEKVVMVNFMGEELSKASARIRNLKAENKKLKQELKEK